MPEREWKQLSADWRRNLDKLVETLDTLNKSRKEVERQKEQIRIALTQGKFDVIDRERAVAFYNSWNRGIRMLPIHPEDYSAKPPSVYLSPLAGPDGPDAYLYELDDGLVTMQQPREWIHVAPPPLVPPTVITLPPPVPGSGVITTVEYPVTAIAGWRVRKIGEGETLSFEDAFVISSNNDTKTLNSDSAVDRRASEAKTVALIAQQINKTVNSSLTPAQSQAIEPITATSLASDPRPGQVVTGFLPPATTIVGVPANSPVFIRPSLSPPLFAPENSPVFVPGNSPAFIRPSLSSPLFAQAQEMRVVRPLLPVMPLPPMVPAWRAKQHREAIGRQYQRIYNARDIDGTRLAISAAEPLPGDDDGLEEDQPLIFDATQ